MLIARYTFKSNIDTLPTFNSDFTYEYTDVNNRDGTITRTITSEGLPTSISFSGETGLASLSYLNTSSVTDMSCMFEDCYRLTTIDVSNFDTSNVICMESMFRDCERLTSIDASSFNTSNVTNMGEMFFGCPALISLDVSSFDTSNVTTMYSMFEECTSLTTLDLSSFDTSNVDNMTLMFSECTSLTSLNLSSFDTSKVIYTSLMFYNCSNLISVNMTDTDYNSINKIITNLPTRTANNQGSLIVPKIDNSINISTADSKYWIVSPDPTNIRHAHLGDMVISNLYIGEVEIKKICLGEIIVYENKQAATDKNILYNEFTGTLFVLKEDALSYDEEELALNINSDIINVSYNEENLDIGGDK